MLPSRPTVSDRAIAPVAHVWAQVFLSESDVHA